MRQLIKRFTVYTLSTTAVLSILFFPELVFAQAAGSNDALKNFSEIAATLVHVITGAAMLMIQFFPPLWGSELITGDQVTGMLRPMWIYIRNLTNIAFVGMLLFLAFSNLLTAGKGVKDWNIKSKLGPVILGLVAINFSMLAIRVAVDLIHVGTVALLSIADPVIEARGINNVADYYGRSVDTETFEDCTDGGGANFKNIRELVNNTFCASTDACLFSIKEIGTIQAQAESMNNPEKKNIMLAFATFFMKLESLPLLSAETGGLLDVLDSAIFSLVFGLAYLLALAAMMVVLLVRVVMMWVFIIFSPILVTGWVLGINMGEFSSQFTKYLLVPIKAAAALAFGFVMIAQLQLMTIPSEFFVSVIEPGASLKSLWGPDEFGGWRMLWSILTVVLFWKVVFDFALTGMPGAAAIKSFGEKAGSAALSFGADQVPIGIPGAEGKSMTLASLLPGGGLNPNQFLQTYSNRARSEAGSDTSFNSLVGASESSQATVDEFRPIRDGVAAGNALSTRQQTKFLDDFEATNRTGQQEMLRVMNLAFRQKGIREINADNITNRGQLQAAIDERGEDARNVFQTTAPRTGDTDNRTAPEVTVETGATNMTVTIGDTQIPLPNGEDKSGVINTLRGRDIPEARLRQIYQGLTRSDDSWDGITEEVFVEEASA